MIRRLRETWIRLIRKIMLRKRLRSSWIGLLYPEIGEKTDFTGANRPDFFPRDANQFMVRAIRGRQPLSIAYMDVDDLKKINDTEGHDKGNKLLEDFGTNIKEQIRLNYDLFARSFLAGDEFILVFPNTRVSAAKKIMCRIHERFPKFSWGIREWNKKDSLELLIKKAENAMYRKKAENRGKTEKGKISNPVGKPRL